MSYNVKYSYYEQKKVGNAMKRICALLLAGALLCCSLGTTAVAAGEDMLRVGIKYGSEAMDAANLQNYSAFGGYALGYYDTSGAFTELFRLSAAQEKITMTTDTAYHVQLAGEWYDASRAEATAAQYGGYVAYENGAFCVRLGTYSDYAAAQSAGARYGGTVVSAGSSAVLVTDTATGELLFSFDCGSSASLGVQPVETTEKTVTWFRGYRYYGGFEYRRAADGRLSVINVVDIEDYVKCVIPWEMDSDWPLEALKAQAVCARTYAVTQHKHTSQGFDVCASTHCQVYQGTAKCSSHSDSAVTQTAGEYLWYRGGIVNEAVYYSSNGGASESSENVWNEEIPYLVGKIDPYESYVAARVPKYSWSTTYTADELTQLLRDNGYRVGTVKNAYVSVYTDTGNVYAVTFVGTLGSATVTREACRTLLNLRSQRFTINGGGGTQYAVNEDGGRDILAGASVIDGSGTVSTLSGELSIITADGVQTLEDNAPQTAVNQFVITGTGNGHNVGMSQWGAYAMADLGYDYQDILQFYYTGVTIG